MDNTAPADVRDALNRDDLLAAAAWWRQSAPRARRALLDAPTGPSPSAQTADRAFAAALRDERQRIRAVTDALRTRSISLADWQRAMRAVIVRTHLAAGALADGGWASMRPETRWQAARAVAEQLGYLDALVAGIEARRVAADGALAGRAVLYGGAAYAFGAGLRAQRMANRGARMERNVLGIADHCAGCLDATALGWVPLGSLPAIGARACRQNCRCTIEYAAAPGQSEAP